MDCVDDVYSGDVAADLRMERRGRGVMGSWDLQRCRLCDHLCFRGDSDGQQSVTYS